METALIIMALGLMVMAIVVYLQGKLLDKKREIENQWDMSIKLLANAYQQGNESVRKIKELKDEIKRLEKLV